MEQHIFTNENAEEISRFKAELINIYIESFSGEPYNEKFTPADVENVIHSWLHLSGGFSLIIADHSVVAGFIAGYNLQEEDALGEIICNCSSDLICSDIFYVADLCIAKKYRRNGYATKLIESLLDNNIMFNEFIARTNCVNTGSQKSFIHNGFAIMNQVDQVVKSKRIDGTLQQDRRIFLYYKRKK
ncbi:MAG: GNAT family N-acetyltransferase [Candidatus Electrothrix sp. AX2]|nr:GNAT family N-acetyltransferase [Candidatus Electrothrix gigas]